MFPKRGASVKRTHFLARDDFHDNPEGANRKIHFRDFRDNPEGANRKIHFHDFRDNPEGANRKERDDFHDNPEGANRKIHFHDFHDNPEGANRKEHKQPRTLLKNPPDEENKMKENKKYIFYVGTFFSSRFLPPT